MIVDLIICLYILGYEISQIIIFKTKYFTNTFWSTVKLISISLTFATTICGLAEINEQIFTTLSSVAIFLFWGMFLYFARLFKDPAILVAMIVEIVKGMRYFMLILLLSVIGFAMAYYILARNNQATLIFFTGNNIFYAFTYTWSILMH